MEEKRAVNLLTFGTYILMLTTSMCNTLLGPLLTDIIDQYQLKAALQGLLSAAQSAGSMAALVIGLFLAGRVKKPIVMAVVSALMAFAMLGAGLKPVLVILGLLYLLFGIAKGLNDTLTSSSIADMHEGRKQASCMGSLHGAYGVGGLLAPLLIVQLKMKRLPWNDIYLVFAGIALVSFMTYLIMYLRTRTAVRPYMEKNPHVNIKAIAAYLRVKRNGCLLGAALCFAFYQIGYFLWINRYIGSDLGTPQMGSVALSLFWIGTAAARILVPRLKISPVKSIIWGNITAVAFALIGIWSKNVSVIIGCSLIAGFANGAVISLLLHIGCSGTKNNTMLFSTLMFFALYIGQITSPLVVGAVSEKLGLVWGMSIAIAFALLSSVFMLKINDKKRNVRNIEFSEDRHEQKKQV